MKAKTKKIKGKNFESKVAKIIHKFLINNFDQYKMLIESIDDSVGVKRDKDSGISINSKGDIDLGVAINFFPFAIECKKREDLEISFKILFKLNKSKLFSIYKNQPVKKSKEHNLIPLLIFSKNYCEIFVFFDINYFNYKFVNEIYNYNHLKSENYVIMLLNDFLEVWRKSYEVIT